MRDITGPAAPSDRPAIFGAAKLARSAPPPAAVPRPVAAAARATAAPAPVATATAAPSPVPASPAPAGAPAPVLDGRNRARLSCGIADGRAVDRGGRHARGADEADAGRNQRRKQDSTHSEVSSPGDVRDLTDVWAIPFSTRPPCSRAESGSLGDAR